MKFLSRFRLVLIFSVFAAAFLSAAKPKKEPDVLIVADNFGHDVESTRPTKENPIHYVLLGGQQWDLGNSVAGEKMPPPSELESVIHRTLESQGFTRTEVGGPMPNIVVIYGYGSAHLEVDEFSEDEFDVESGEFLGASTTSVAWNSREMYALAGANKIKGRVLSAAVADEITDAIESGRLYIMISALDAQALQAKKKQIVWRNRISIPSRRNSLPNFMEMMVATAGPYFGTDSDLPVVLREEDRRKTEVQIGETTVLEEAP